MRKIIVYSLWSIVCGSLWSIPLIGSRGPFGARESGIGAFVGIADDANTVFYNPAGLGFLNKGEISTSYGRQFSVGIGRTLICYAHPTRKLGGFGIGIQNVSYGEMERRDKEGKIPLGTFTRNDLKLFLSYAYKYEVSDVPIGIGITGKLVKVNLGKLSSGMGSSIGLGGLAKLGHLINAPGHSIDVGLSICDIGNAWIKDTKGMRQLIDLWNAKLGAAYSYQDIFKLALDIDTDRRGVGSHIALGGEWNVMRELLCLRGGFQKDMKTSNSTGFNVGLSLNWEGLKFHYAYTTYTIMTNTQHFSVSYEVEGIELPQPK